MRVVPGAIAILLTACGPTVRPSFDSPEPAARNQAAVQAAERRDRSAVPHLVRMLDSDDPATRLVAGAALKRITGETLGYDPVGPESERREAIARWEAYVGKDTR